MHEAEPLELLVLLTQVQAVVLEQSPLVLVVLVSLSLDIWSLVYKKEIIKTI